MDQIYNKTGWGGGIWTHAWRSQSPLPYHLATPQHKKVGWDIRVELMTSSATNWRPNQLGQSHHVLLWQKSGALWGTRTSGLLLRRQLLYPAELTAHILWSGWWESNPRDQLGRLGFYHWTTPAHSTLNYYNTFYRFCQGLFIKKY